MELFEHIDANDKAITDRVRWLDKQATELGTYLTYDTQPFALAEYVSANLEEHPQLHEFGVHSLLVLWTACCVDREKESSVDDLLADRFPDIMLLPARTVLCAFIRELSETIYLDIPTDERGEQLRTLSDLIRYDPHHADDLIARAILEDFRNEIRGISYCAHQLFALPYLLQVQVNFSDLIDHRFIRRIARRLRVGDSHPPVQDWVRVIRLLDHSESYQLTLQLPSVLEHFISGFVTHAPSKIRCLQLFTIYHPEWKQIWTVYGWRCNRLECSAVELFLHEFPVPFYQETFLNDFFAIFQTV